MTDQELEILLNDLESDRVERKASLAEKDKIYQAVCAFANDMPNHSLPGVLFIGANDDGTCAKFQVTDERLRELADIRSSGNILPLPTMTVQKRVLNGCELAVVIIEPADAPPVRFKGRVWIRVGPRRAIASVEEERRLSEKRRSRDLPFDLSPIPSASIQDLDLELFRNEYLPSALPLEILEENQRTIQEQLSAMRFVSARSLEPTILGLLVTGKEPERFVHGAYIQFLRIDGTQFTDPVKDQKQLAGPLTRFLQLLDTILHINITTAVGFTAQPVEVRQSDYPLVALQQITRNAVMHRSYDGTNAPVRITWFSDRVEIQNPGGPFGQVTKQNFGRPGITDYRNPHLAEAMKNLGYVQRFGVGIELARKEMEKNGNPPLEFSVEETYVLAVLRRRP